MLNIERLCLGCMNDNGGEKYCPVCGFNNASANPDNALPLKFIVNSRYILGKVVSANGEGITYMAWDTIENTAVNVREYFPIGFAVRNPDSTVAMVAGGEYAFNEGLLQFLELNKKIMQVELASLVPVTEIFEENGTAYVVSKHIVGITLAEFLGKNGGTLKWEQARALFLPLIDTLSSLSEMGIIHGGISPETILVGRDGKLRIIGYSISKLRIATANFSSELFDGYAATEQYGLVNEPMGPATDVYGLSATLFNVLIGIVPPVSSQRLQNDAMSIPAKFAEELPRHVLSSIANGLQVYPKNRTKNLDAFRNELVYGEVDVAPKVVKVDVTSDKKKGGVGKYILISAICTAVVCLAAAAFLAFGPLKSYFFPKEENKPVSQQQEDDKQAQPPIEEEEEVDNTPKYPVPNCVGRQYYEILEDDSCDMFNFIIDYQAFSDTVPEGAVISQEISSGEEVERDTTIKLVVSAGPRTVTVPTLLGLSQVEAEKLLLQLGFVYGNIEVDTTTMIDPAQDPGAVIKQTIQSGKKVSRFSKIKIYINGYVPQEESEEPEFSTGLE